MHKLRYEDPEGLRVVQVECDYRAGINACINKFIEALSHADERTGKTPWHTEKNSKLPD